MIRFLKQRWFLLLLAMVLVVGIGSGTRLRPLADLKWLRDADVAAVLFLMALPLDAATIWRTIRRPLAAVLAVLVSFVVLPLVAWGVSLVVGGGQGPGLLIAAATPCTVASAAVWTRRAGGNDAIATLVTVITNALCFIVTPLWLLVFFGGEARSDELEFGQAVLQLGRLVVIPMIAAQLARLYRPLAAWAFRHKVALSVLAQCGILYMVLIGAVQTGLQFAGHAGAPALVPGPFDFAVMLAAVALVHTSMCWFGFQLAGWCGLPRDEQIAVGFSGSQKTLMIGLKVALDNHMSILPMVTFHVSQLLIDTLIADRLARGSPPARTVLPPPPSSGTPSAGSSCS